MSSVNHHTTKLQRSYCPLQDSKSMVYQLTARYTRPSRNLSPLLQSFLYERSITVRIQNTYSSHHLIPNGVPQGEVWSVPLFLIAINDLINCVTFPLIRRLFADDFSVSFASANPKRAARLLQLTLKKISSWSSARGFRFSDSKTILVICRKSHSHSPSLLLLSYISKISKSACNCSPNSLV